MSEEMTTRCQDSTPLPNRKLSGFCAVGLLVSAGCMDQASQAGKFEVNGFVCASTGEKFYTDKDVFPDHCSTHKNANFAEVVVFLFSNGDTLIGPRADAMHHPTLGETSTGVRFPTEDELVEWGATRKSKEEVTMND